MGEAAALSVAATNTVWQTASRPELQAVAGNTFQHTSMARTSATLSDETNISAGTDRKARGTPVVQSSHGILWKYHT